MSEDQVWHLFAGFAGLVLSLVVGISAWFLNHTIKTIMRAVNNLEYRIESLAERVAKLEGIVNGK